MLALTLTFGLAVAGCGTATPSKDGAQSTGSAGQAGAASTDQKLVVYSAGPDGLAKKLVAGYEAQSGVKVELFQGTTGKILARMEAEKANPVADVVVLASLPSVQGLKKTASRCPTRMPKTRTS